jgi:hypothetical protein
MFGTSENAYIDKSFGGNRGIAKEQRGQSSTVSILRKQCGGCNVMVAT